MSHLIKADFSAELIRSEAVFEQALKRLDEYNIENSLKEQLIKEFELDKVQKLFKNLRGKRVTESQYIEVKQKADKIHQLFNIIENYIIQNFNLQVDNYNEEVNNLVKLWTNQNSSILKQAIEEIEDENLKAYALKVFKLNPTVSKELLLKKAEELYKNSKEYRQKIIEKNIEILKKKKGIKKEIEHNEINNSTEVIRKINNEKNEKEIETTVRNRVLSSIVNIIRGQGFIVKKENIVDKGEYAVINAIKPDGKRTRFEVYLDGRFKYKFDQYEGLSCEKDIEKFEKNFEKIYGIKLDNKKILWSNPDRISKQAHKTINNKKIGG